MSGFDIDRIKRKTLVKYPLFNRIIANVSLRESFETQTAGTNGKEIVFNPKFMSSKSEEEQIFIFAHEISHVALDHVKRSEGKDQRVWNEATDAVINAFLKKDGLTAPHDVIEIENANMYDAETMYEKLLKDKENNKDSSNGDGLSNDSGTDKPNFDDHEMWDKQYDNNDKGNFNENDEDLRKAVGEFSDKGERQTFSDNQSEVQRNIEEVIKKMAEESISVGNDPGEKDLEMEGVGTARMLIDWRRYLKETVNYNVDWSYQDAEIENGVLIPHLIDIPPAQTEIVLDTSGSVDIELLKCFLRECKNILNNSAIKAGCFDTKFYGFTEIRTEDDIDNMPFKGGGGTNFDAAVNAFSRRVENKIIFTDGEASMPQRNVDAIWVVFGNHKITPRGGKVIYVSENDLRKAYGFSSGTIRK